MYQICLKSLNQLFDKDQNPEIRCFLPGRSIVSCRMFSACRNRLPVCYHVLRRIDKSAQRKTAHRICADTGAFYGLKAEVGLTDYFLVQRIPMSRGYSAFNTNIFVRGHK